MIKRIIEKQLLQLVRNFPAVCVLGPRQVGKTTLIKQIALTVKKTVLYLDVERPADRLKLQDPESYLAQHSEKCVIIDEVQFMPALFEVIGVNFFKHIFYSTGNGFIVFPSCNILRVARQKKEFSSSAGQQQQSTTGSSSWPDETEDGQQRDFQTA